MGSCHHWEGDGAAAQMASSRGGKPATTEPKTKVDKFDLLFLLGQFNAAPTLGVCGAWAPITRRTFMLAGSDIAYGLHPGQCLTGRFKPRQCSNAFEGNPGAVLLP